MKKRAGFVSNSSTSSFIVGKEEFPTIWDVVIPMLEVRNDDLIEKHAAWELDGPEVARLKDELIRALKRKCVGDDNPTAITFGRCINFNTFVWDAGDSWWIACCNNHPYYTLFSHRDYDTQTPCPYPDYSLLDYIELQMEDDKVFEEI